MSLTKPVTIFKNSKKNKNKRTNIYTAQEIEPGTLFNAETQEMYAI